jgi:toxin ParE1/3/4
MMVLIWSAPALSDLERIGDFIAEYNLVASVEMTDRIYAAPQRLVQFPGSGREGRAPDTRELVVAGTSYIVAYRIKQNRIEILAVIHGTQQ